MTDQNRVAAGVPTGGQFAGHDRAEAGIELPPLPPAATVSLPAFASLHFDDDPLPDYPAELPKPEVYFEYDDGRIETSIDVGDETVRFWESTWDGVNDSLSNNGGTLAAANGDDEVQYAFTEWGAAVHKRLDDLAYSIAIDAVTPNSSKLIDIALGIKDDGDVGGHEQRFKAVQSRIFELQRLEARLAAASLADRVREVYPEAAAVELAVSDQHDQAWVPGEIVDADGNPIDDVEDVLHDSWDAIATIPGEAPYDLHAGSHEVTQAPGFDWFAIKLGATNHDATLRIDLTAAQGQRF